MNRNNTSFTTILAEHLRQLPHTRKYLKYYQMLTAHVLTELNLDTRGLLVKYQMGGGKSHLAVHIAIETLLAGQRQVVMLQSKSLEANMRGAIYKYVAIRQTEEPDFYLARLSPDDLAKWIDRNFSFVSANASNMIGQLSRKMNPDEVFGSVSHMNTLDGKLLIVDEAHNLFRSITNGGKNAIALYELIMRSKNLKCVFLTGTPIANDVFEMVPCFNMLASMKPNNPILPEAYREFYNLYVDLPNKRMKNRGKLQNRLLGLISSFNQSNPPAGITALTEFPEQLPTVYRFVHMSPKQYTAYLLARDKEADEGKTTGKRVGPSADPPSMTKPKSKSSSTYRVKSRQLSNVLPGWTDAPTDEHSPKFAQIYADMEGHTGQLGLVYSQFTGMGGLGAFEKYLQAAGWKRYEISPAVYEGGSMPDPFDFIAEVERSTEELQAKTGGGRCDIRARFAKKVEIPNIKRVFPDFEPADENIVIESGGEIVGFVTANVHKSASGAYRDVLKAKGVYSDLVARVQMGKARTHFKPFLGRPPVDPPPIDMDTIVGSAETVDIVALAAGLDDDNGHSEQNAPSTPSVRSASSANSVRSATSANGVHSTTSAQPVIIADEDPSGDPFEEEDPTAVAEAAGIDISGISDANNPTRQRHYCVISGEVDPEYRARLSAVFNNASNGHGEIIDLILTSSTGAEGLDLKRLRYVMMMEAYWNPSREKQLFARGVRNDSHIDLPSEEKNVTPYIYLAIPPREETLPGKSPIVIKTFEDLAATYAPTTDVELYTESAKSEELIKDAVSMMEEITIECLLLADPSHCRNCNPTDEPLFSANPTIDVSRVDPCTRAEAKQITTSAIVVDGVEYRYAPSDSVFGWDIYEFAEDIHAWKVMRESDDRHSVVLAAVMANEEE